RRRGRVAPEPDRVGAAGSVRGGPDERTGRRARRELPLARAARRRILAGRALERDWLPAGLLPEVPSVRPVLSALGPGNLSPRACLNRRSPRRCAPSTPSAAGPSELSSPSGDSG